MAKEDFDSWDAYFIPGTQTLKNKLGIRDRDELARAEYEITFQRIDELRIKPIQGNFDLDHLRAIHREIFQDVYEWAGELRTVNMAKGNSMFARHDLLESAGKDLSRKRAADPALRTPPDKNTLVERLADHYADWNALHPFREGNGRSTRVFMEQIANRAGYSLDQQRIDTMKERWNAAASRSMLGDTQPIQQIFKEALRPQRAVAFEELSRAEAMQRHPELRDAYMRLEIERARLKQAHPQNPKAVEHFMGQKASEMLRLLDTGKVPELTPAERQNADAASAFLSKPPREAVREHPNLAGPLAALGSYKAALERQGIDPAQQEAATQRMRQALAERVLTGQYRSVETQQVRFPQRAAQERAQAHGQADEQSPL